MEDKIIKVFEISDFNLVNKLLDTGVFTLLGLYNKNTENQECPSETEIIYSVGQHKLGYCMMCEENDLEYFYNGYYISFKCKNGRYSGDID